jgi:NAD(P)-dependent dehydrogenase (short-subunit alcohol dehydrogenase family)
MDRVRNKVCLVTGAARGIGRATAELLVREGGTVYLSDLDEPAGEAAAKEIAGATDAGRVRFVPLDVREEPAWEQAVARVLADQGRIDVLVNNAGVYLIKPLPDCTHADLEHVFATNVRGTFLGMRHAAPIMAAHGGGSIVNLSSMDANVGSEGHTVYGGSKGAVRAMTKDVAIEYAKQKVRVNSVHPGYIHTEMAEYGARYYGESIAELGKEFPVGHIGRPIDVAYAVLYLASDESRFVTGAELAVDGGALAS